MTNHEGWEEVKNHPEWRDSMASPLLRQKGNHFIPQIIGISRNWKVSNWSYRICLKTYDPELCTPLGMQASRKHGGLRGEEKHWSERGGGIQEAKQ